MSTEDAPQSLLSPISSRLDFKGRAVTVIGGPHLGAGQPSRFNPEEAAPPGKGRIPGNEVMHASRTIRRRSHRFHKTIPLLPHRRKAESPLGDIHAAGPRAPRQLIAARQGHPKSKASRNRRNTPNGQPRPPPAPSPPAPSRPGPQSLKVTAESIFTRGPRPPSPPAPSRPGSFPAARQSQPPGLASFMCS